MTLRHPFWFLFYNLAIIPPLFLGMHIARLFNGKVREGIRGRKGLFRRLKEARRNLPPDKKFVVIHCASAGEFEAARPLLLSLRQRLPNVRVHVTCYSPSGKRPISRAEEVESHSYLPFDDLNSARRFFNILKPAAFIFIKHDVWPNMVGAAARRKIPVLWVNANLHAKTRRLGLLSRGLNRSFLSQITEVLTVGDDHAVRLSRLVSPEKIEVIGDSRFDQAVLRMNHSNGVAAGAIPQDYLQGKKVIVAGSTWGPDQRILIPAFAELRKENPELFVILVPHEPRSEFLEDTDAYLKGFGLRSLRLTRLDGAPNEVDVIVVDKVGILASLYREAWVAYVGGAFGGGVHSVLEPAVYHIPLFFGPKYYMAHEASVLVQRGAARSVTSSAELEGYLRKLLEDDNAWRQAAETAAEVFKMGCGATEKIVEHLEVVLPQNDQNVKLSSGTR